MAKLVKSAELPGKARAIGIGAHRCAGPNLAQMEMEAALKTCFERIPEFELTDPDAVTWPQTRYAVPATSPCAFNNQSASWSELVWKSFLGCDDQVYRHLH
ncbi:MAG: hypothetical protein HOK21_02920 [Rhodospirillaceae bacterium]|nr:hypothetical protein [Rhodospirillaceae bacterium]MBT5083807.1 hypothetical protein [Rhodospirillaceae bacterium]MBT5523014.1 hypothetical protein [Rhodospirillaceae bacterium]MBT5880271.1 hypothetical protein [Rhodospirillaceae bacterium]MBT6588894.1 hypothetical protein [Rhodospirillaceae bacterium]